MSKFFSILLLLLCLASAMAAPGDAPAWRRSHGHPASQRGTQKPLPPAKPQRMEAPATKVVGPFVRTEQRDLQELFSLGCQLQIEPALHQPRLRLVRQQTRTWTEVRVYQMVLRTFVPQGDGYTGDFTYTPIPGEFHDGETIERQERIDGQPLANAPVTLRVNGRPIPECRTDADGCLTSPYLDILADLDNLSKRTVDYQIECEHFQPLRFRLFRTMPQRPPHDDHLLDEPPAQDVLMAYGLDFHQWSGQQERERLQASVRLTPATPFVRTGLPFLVTVSITNQGKTPTKCLLGRSFSRQRLLHGKLFYFGAIAPGATATFSRLMMIEPPSTPNKAFLEVALCDANGPLPIRLPLEIPVIH